MMSVNIGCYNDGGFMFKIKEPKNFSDVWSGIQSIVTSIAIIAGAFWTMITFSVLGEVNRKQLDINASRAQLENLELTNAKLRQKQDEQGALDLEIVASQQEVRGDKNRYINVLVKLKNVGTRDVAMCFEDPEENLPSSCDSTGPRRHFKPPIHVARATLRSDQVIFHEVATGVEYRGDLPEEPIRAIVIRAGQTELYTAAVRVSDAGLYRISFFSYFPQKEKTVLLRSFKPFWIAVTFLAVK